MDMEQFNKVAAEVEQKKDQIHHLFSMLCGSNVVRKKDLSKTLGVERFAMVSSLCTLAETMEHNILMFSELTDLAKECTSCSVASCVFSQSTERKRDNRDSLVLLEKLNYVLSTLLIFIEEVAEEQYKKIICAVAGSITSLSRLTQLNNDMVVAHDKFQASSFATRAKSDVLLNWCIFSNGEVRLKKILLVDRGERVELDYYLCPPLPFLEPLFHLPMTQSHEHGQLTYAVVEERDTFVFRKQMQSLGL